MKSNDAEGCTDTIAIETCRYRFCAKELPSTEMLHKEDIPYCTEACARADLDLFRQEVQQLRNLGLIK